MKLHAALQPAVSRLLQHMLTEYKAKAGVILGYVPEERVDDKVWLRYNGRDLHVFCTGDCVLQFAGARLLAETKEYKCYVMSLDFEAWLAKAQAAARAHAVVPVTSTAPSYSNPLEMSLDDGAIYILQHSNTTVLQCLGFPAGTTKEMAKKRCKALALRYHPDKCDHSFAQSVFHVLNQINSHL